MLQVSFLRRWSSSSGRLIVFHPVANVFVHLPTILFHDYPLKSSREKFPMEMDMNEVEVNMSEEERLMWMFERDIFAMDECEGRDIVIVATDGSQYTAHTYNSRLYSMEQITQIFFFRFYLMKLSISFDN